MKEKVGGGPGLSERGRRRLENTGIVVISELTMRKTESHVALDCRILTPQERTVPALNPANALLC